MPVNPHIIHTEGSGTLAEDCPPERVREIAAAMAEAEHAIIHLHGGLIWDDIAIKMAGRLDPYYRGAPVVPVFFVWETGPIETVRNNLPRIASEKVFKTLVAKLLRHVAGKVLGDLTGAKGAFGEAPLPDPLEVQMELEKLQEISDNNVPYGDKSGKPVSEPTETEIERLEEDLDTDREFELAVAGVLKGLEVLPAEGAKGVAATVAPEPTLMSEDVKVELVATARQPGSKGLLETAALVRRASKIFIRVIKRFSKKRDHGIYTTIVEEVLRELYIDSVGAVLWGSMKDDARDNFSEPDGTRAHGGEALLRELSILLDERKTAGKSLPKLSVIGHSAGTVFACEMLRHIAQKHENLKLHRLVFLAAACRYDLFAEILQLHADRPLWEGFRSFALSDALEKGYWEVPVIYPSSLLYLISGILERDGEESAFDMPLVGMQRYFVQTEIYQDASIKAVRKFLSADNHQVWSNVTGATGLSADAIRHGGFDDTLGERTTTMKSVNEFLQS